MPEPEQIVVLDWGQLDDLEAMERVEWLRENLIAGEDWGVCNGPRMCVLKTESAGMLYRMRWFDGTQSRLNAQDIKTALKPWLHSNKHEI